MIIDTHAHYDDHAFDEDRSEIIEKLKSQNIIAVNAGASTGSSLAAVELAGKYENIYAMIGVHPDEVGELDDEWLNRFLEMSKDPKVVAVGEVGLDYHWNVRPCEEQIEWFVKQIHLAKEAKLPINIHSRDAAADTLEVVKAEYGRGNLRDGGISQKCSTEPADDYCPGIVHCYSYSPEQAAEYARMGFMFGIGGVATFSNSKKLKAVIESLPMDRLVLETDAPYLAPSPYRGERNDSSYLPYVVSAIADIKGMSEEEVERATEQNARRVYRKIK